MKLKRQEFEKNGAGVVKLVVEDSEDMWHAFNLIREGDQLLASSYRKVQKDSSKGGDSERVKLHLQIQVEGIDFDPEGASLRIKGRNLTENEYVKLGAYHTIELEPQREFTLTKELWDAMDVDRIKQATDPKQSADLAAVLITEGLAHVCLVASTTTIIAAKIEKSLPRKRGAAAAGYDTEFGKFMNSVLTAVERHVDFSIVRCLVIAGPGFAKETFKEHLNAEAVRRNLRPLIENKSRIVACHASTAYTGALKEVLADAGISRQIADTKALREVSALAAFHTMMAHDSSRAFYGPGHVFAAHEVGGIKTLLLTDSLFRINNVAKRKKYVDLVESVRDAGGEALVFSAMHESGKQLNQITGIAAILRYPMPDLEDEDIEMEI